MAGLPLVPLIGLGLLFFATPLIVLVLILVLLTLRTRVRRLEARLAGIEQRLGDPAASPASAPAPASPHSPAPAPVPDAELDLFGSVPPVATPAPPATSETAATLTARDAVDVDRPTRVPSAPLESPARAAPGDAGSWEGRVGGTWLSR